MRAAGSLLHSRSPARDIMSECTRQDEAALEKREARSLNRMCQLISAADWPNSPRNWLKLSTYVVVKWQQFEIVCSLLFATRMTGVCVDSFMQWRVFAGGSMWDNSCSRARHLLLISF